MKCCELGVGRSSIPCGKGLRGFVPKEQSDILIHTTSKFKVSAHKTSLTKPAEIRSVSFIIRLFSRHSEQQDIVVPNTCYP